MLFDIDRFLDGFSASHAETGNPFVRKHSCWRVIKGGPQARCDFRPNRSSMANRFKDSTIFCLWRRSTQGMTLWEIKADPDMPQFIADGMTPFIRRVIAHNLDPAQWVLLVPPARRHIEGNFAHRTARLIAAALGLDCHTDAAVPLNKRRIGYEVAPANLPPQPNVILFDDFVTTGSTIKAMHIMLTAAGKTVFSFAAVNNE